MFAFSDLLTFASFIFFYTSPENNTHTEALTFITHIFQRDQAVDFQ